jgi:hypothetical protein
MPTPAHLREQSRLYCRASKEDSTLQVERSLAGHAWWQGKSRGATRGSRSNRRDRNSAANCFDVADRWKGSAQQRGLPYGTGCVERSEGRIVGTMVGQM